MTMGVRSVNNALVLIQLCLFFAFLIYACSSEGVDTKCPKQYYQGIGCITLRRHTRRVPCLQIYNCDRVKHWLAPQRRRGRVTCIVNGHTYRAGEKYVVPTRDKHLVINCVCDAGFPDKPNCSYVLSTFITAVLDHVEDIRPRAAGKSSG